MHSEYQMKTEMFWNKFCFCNDFISSNIRSWCVLHLINRRTFLLCCSYLKVKYVKHLATCSKKGSSSFCHEVSSCKKEASDDRWTLNTVNGCKMLCKRNESGCLRLKCITRPQKSEQWRDKCMYADVCRFLTITPFSSFKNILTTTLVTYVNIDLYD